MVPVLDCLGDLLHNDSIICEPQVVPQWMAAPAKPAYPSIDKVENDGDLCPFAFSLHTKAIPETFWTFYCLCFLKRLYRLLSIEISIHKSTYIYYSLQTKIFQFYLWLLIFSFDWLDCVLFPSTWINVKIYQHNRCEDITRTNYMNQKSVECGKVFLVFTKNSPRGMMTDDYDSCIQWNNSECLGRYFPSAP